MNIKNINSKYLKSVEIKGEDKAKTEVIYHIRKI
jgi:hypothetical protein